MHDHDEDFEEEEEEVKDLPIRPPSRATSTPARVPSLIRPSSPPAPASRARSPSPPVVPMRPTFTAEKSSANGPVRSSTYEQNPFDSQKLQSKWQVRSPQLLSALVGPDRQVRRGRGRGRGQRLFAFSFQVIGQNATTHHGDHLSKSQRQGGRRTQLVVLSLFQMLVSLVSSIFPMRRRAVRTVSTLKNVEKSIRWSNN